MRQNDSTMTTRKKPLQEGLPFNKPNPRFTRIGRQTLHKTKNELVNSHCFFLPYMNIIRCPGCHSLVDANRLKMISGVAVGWCDGCGIGIE